MHVPVAPPRVPQGSLNNERQTLPLADGLHTPGTLRAAAPRQRTEGPAQARRALRAVEEPRAGHDLREGLDAYPAVLRSRHDPARRPGHLPFPARHPARPWRTD